MLQITDEQKLDIAEAMSKHAGGVFYFLSDKIPAIKTSENSKWNKVDTMDWWQIEDLFPFNIEDVPSKLFSLDGAGKIKDFRQMSEIIRSEINKEPSNVPVEKRLAAALTASNITYLELQPLEDVLHGAINRAGRNPKAISENILETQGIPIYWLENHSRSSFKSNGSYFALSDDGVSEVLNDPADIVMASRYFINESAYCEKRFIKDFHELCGSRNLIPSVGVGAGVIGKLDSSVKSVLSAAYALGTSGDERNMIKAIMSLTYKHEPLGVAKNKVPAAVHIKKIKDLLSKKNTETAPVNTPTSKKSSLKIAELINARDRVEKLNNAVEKVTSKTDDPVWVKITWSRFFSNKDISAWNEDNVDELKNQLKQAEKVFFPYLRSKVGSMRESIGIRVPNAEISNENALSVLREVWRGMNRSLGENASNPTKQIEICYEFSDILSEEKLSQLKGDNPDLDCLNEIRELYFNFSEKEKLKQNEDSQKIEQVDSVRNHHQEVIARPRFN
jgi:hypothetical protein